MLMRLVGEASVLGCPKQKGLVGCLSVHEPLNGAKTSALIQVQGRSAGCLLTHPLEAGSLVYLSSVMKSYFVLSRAAMISKLDDMPETIQLMEPS